MRLTQRLCDQCGCNLLCEEAFKLYFNLSVMINHESKNNQGKLSFPNESDFCSFPCLRSWAECNLPKTKEMEGEEYGR